MSWRVKNVSASTGFHGKHHNVPVRSASEESVAAGRGGPDEIVEVGREVGDGLSVAGRVTEDVRLREADQGGEPRFVEGVGEAFRVAGPVEGGEEAVVAGFCRRDAGRVSQMRVSPGSSVVTARFPSGAKWA